MNTTNMIPEDSLAEKFRVVTRLGEMMIKNGGEIFRAEASMRYAAKAYGLTEFEPYVLANGIFCSFCEDGKVYSSRILSIPLSPIALSRVEELNTLSRRIATGNCTIAEADAEMNRIEKMNTGSTWMMLAGGAIGAGAFSILFSGTWRDGICALLAGLILELVSVLSDSSYQLSEDHDKYLRSIFDVYGLLHSVPPRHRRPSGSDDHRPSLCDDTRSTNHERNS